MAVGEWDRRELCPDGACVGVIGADGLCKACGRAATNWGNERERGLNEASADADDDDDEDEDEDAEGELATSHDGDGDGEGDEGDDDDDEDDDDEDGDDGDEEDDDDDDDEDDEEEDALDPSTPTRLGAAKDWHERTLCSDGGCVGVIGDDGKCKTCGKAAA